MKYYKIEIERTNKMDNILVGRANGEKIPDANYYFYEMREGKILLDAPVFDYFFLESYEEKKYWEEYLLDVHSFIGQGSQILGWFVSEDLKLLLENFILSKPYHFYHSKLLYKGNKLDYYIFQFDGNLISNEIRTKYIEWNKSIFQNPIDEEYLSINSLQEFIDKYRSIMKMSKYDKSIIPKKVVLNQTFDLFPLHVENSSPHIISERLKGAIETMGITGFEFSELDYEVVVG
jgi:hypothetical protein